MPIRRRLILLAVLAVVAASCSGDGKSDGLPSFGSGKSDGGADFSGGGGGLPDISDDGPLEPFMVAAAPVRASSGGLRGALDAAGVRVIDDPSQSTGSGMELWSYQVSNMEREIDSGSGYLGVQLDDLVGSPGGMPFSYLVAGWLSAAPTPVAEDALGLIGEQTWEDAPNLVFPTAVLVLFVADAVKSSDSADVNAMPTAQLASVAQSGICSTLAGWVNGVLDFIFESLKVDTSDGGFLGWLGAVWNAALDLARGIVEGLIDILTAPIVDAITGALAIAGTLSMVASILQPWTLDLEVTNTVTRFAVGDGPNVQEQVVAHADPGYEFEWPAAVEDCASVAGLELPNPTRAEGSEIKWKEIGFPEFGSVVELESTLDTENMARADWVTGREESAKGPERSGTVSIFAAVDLKQIQEIKAMVGTLITGQLPSGPFDGIVSSIFDSLIAPIFEALADLIRIKGAAQVTVIYHDEEEEDVVTQPPTGAAECLIGRWTANGPDSAAIYGAQIAASDPSQQAYSEGSVTAEFRDDGTVSLDYSGWRIGALSTTPAIEGLTRELHGDVYTLSNGSADGIWFVDEGLLELRLGFETSVVQRVVSPELEIDSTIDAAPGFSRLYLIPSGKARFICNDSQMAIEWENGAGVRWFRR